MDDEPSRLERLEVELAALAVVVNSLASVVKGLGVQLVDGVARIRTIRSPDGSIDISVSEDRRCIDIVLPDGFEERASKCGLLEDKVDSVKIVVDRRLSALEQSVFITLPGASNIRAYPAVSPDEERKEVRVGWLLVVGAAVLGAAFVGFVWWLQ